MTIHVDNDSPPGSWQREIELTPWRYKVEPSTDEVLARIRAAGLWREAQHIQTELAALRARLAEQGNRSE